MAAQDERSFKSNNNFFAAHLTVKDLLIGVSLILILNLTKIFQQYISFIKKLVIFV